MVPRAKLRLPVGITKRTKGSQFPLLSRGNLAREITFPVAGVLNLTVESEE
jgi:hypothetical protein